MLNSDSFCCYKSVFIAPSIYLHSHLPLVILVVRHLTVLGNLFSVSLKLYCNPIVLVLLADAPGRNSSVCLLYCWLGHCSRLMLATLFEASENNEWPLVRVTTLNASSL